MYAHRQAYSPSGRGSGAPSTSPAASRNLHPPLTRVTLAAMSERTRISITLPQDLIDKYHAIADRQQKTVEQAIETQLYKYQDVESSKPLTLNDQQRQHVEQLLGRNITTPDEFVSILQRKLDLFVDGVSITLTPYLLDRLRSRCIGMEWDKFLQMTIKRQIEEFVGVR